MLIDALSVISLLSGRPLTPALIKPAATTLTMACAGEAASSRSRLRKFEPSSPLPLSPPSQQCGLAAHRQVWVYFNPPVGERHDSSTSGLRVRSSTVLGKEGTRRKETQETKKNTFVIRCALLLVELDLVFHIIESEQRQHEIRFKVKQLTCELCAMRTRSAQLVDPSRVSLTMK